MKGKNVVTFLAPICQQKDHKSNQDQQRQKKKIRFVINKISFSFCYSMSNTVFENHRKSLIQLCERSELRLHFEWTKVVKNAKNG